MSYFFLLIIIEFPNVNGNDIMSYEHPLICEDGHDCVIFCDGHNTICSDSLIRCSNTDNCSLICGM